MARFPTTQWSLVRRVCQASPAASRDQLGQLLDAYWLPMYAHVRYKGLGPEQAEDLIQDFMLEILDKRLLSSADPSRGRLRTLLLTALDRFVITQHRRATAAKRSPGQISSLASLPDDILSNSTPSSAEAFDRAWCLDVLAQALARMQRECEARDQILRWRLFDQRVLGPLFDDVRPPSFRELAQACELADEKAAMNQLVSAKRQFARQLRQIIREYITHDGSVTLPENSETRPEDHSAQGGASAVDAGDALAELAVRQEIEREINELRAILSKTRSVVSLTREIPAGTEPLDPLKSDFWLRLTQRQTVETTNLADMFQMGSGDSADEPVAEEFTDMMNAPLRDLPGLEYAGPGTLRELIWDPAPPVELLRRVKDWANVGRLGQDALLPTALANGIYFLILAAALEHAGARITGLPDSELRAGFEWLDEQTWLESDFHPLARRVLYSIGS